MPEGFEAGSIFVALRAQLDDFNKGIASAKTTLDSLGAASAQTVVEFKELDTSVQVFKEIETRSARTRTAFASLGAESKRTTTALRSQAEASRSTADSFLALDRSTAVMATRIARAVSAIFLLQQAVEGLAGPNKSAGVQGATTGLQTFGAVALAFPNPVGIAVGALAGLTAGFVTYSREVGEAIGATEKLKAAIEAFNKKKFDFAVESGFIGRTQTGIQRDLSLLQLQRQQQEDLLRTALKSQQTQRDKLEAGEISADEAQEAIDRAEKLIKLTRARLRDIAAAEAVKDRQAIAEQNKILLEGTAVQLQAGLISPLEAVHVEAQAAQKELEELLKLGSKTDPTALGLALDKVKAARAREDQIKAVNDLSSTFSTAVGDGLRDAILNASKPMEALAAIGQNLFGNMIDQSVKRLEVGLQDAFKALTGPGGEGVGLAITAGLGAAGAVLSRLGSKGEDRFANVQSAVTSTQAFRGVVAGPSSVAIATVQDDLARAVAPVVNRLDGVIGILTDIRNQGRGGGRGGLSSNVGVATV